MSSRFTIMGLDGMDSDIVNRLRNSLPCIRHMKNEGWMCRLESVFPPDSDTAWASIFTGLDPSEHGVVKFVDPLEKSISYQTDEPDITRLRSKYIWDILSAKGRRVCIILPHGTFPPWDVNGIMISRSSLTNEVSATPRGAIAETELQGLTAPRGFPGGTKRSRKTYIQNCVRLFENTRKVSLRLFERENWDFFFVYSPILDIIPHFFWRFFDSGDPDYPGDNEYRDLVPRLYMDHDAFIGDFVGRLGPEDTLAVVSDHGHGRRPILEFKMNQVLRRNGLLFADNRINRRAGLSQLSMKTAMTLSRFCGFENLYSLLLRKLPGLRKSITHSSSIDWTRTIAATVDLSGIKSYSYGGIRIDREIIPDSDDYELVREKVIQLILSTSNPRNGDRIAEWAKRREDLYHGEFINRFPDIVYQLAPAYGFSPTVEGVLVEKSRVRSVVPGTHLGSNSVLMMIGKNADKVERSHKELLAASREIMQLIMTDYSDNEHRDHEANHDAIRA